jgi:O-methyltransferase involved in polyketide biosynthesis
MYDLSSTSALVLLWAQQDCYQSKAAKEYLSRLNLDIGKNLYEECKKIWSHYDEVIKNRKCGVFDLIEKCVNSAEDKCQQVIIAGAGFDALGIEIVEQFPQIRVFELDRENMKIKSQLIANIKAGDRKNIVFIETDLLDVSCVCRNLRKHEWNPKKSTLLILEGISYYLSPTAIKKIVQTIKPDRTIFEFLKLDKEIAVNRIEIPKKIFGKISKLCALPDIEKYDYSKIEKLFDNSSVTVKYSMKDLEEMRTAENKFFPTEDSGWINVCLLKNNRCELTT